MELSGLLTLREKLLGDKDLSQIYTYFLDHFGENKEFMALGESVREPFLEQIMLQIGAQFWQGSIALAGLFLKEIPEYKFLHGAGHLNGRLSTVIYFEEVKTGLCVVTYSVAPPETRFARFRAARLKPTPEPSEN